MSVENRTKIANFPTPVYLTPPLKVFLLEFCIGTGVSRNWNDGAFRWSKKFSDRFSRFDTIPECDRHPATQTRCRSKYRAYAQVTRSSADADNRLDAFSGQSRSTNMVPFHMLHIVSNLLCNSNLTLRDITIFVFKKIHDLEMGSKVTQGH